MNDVKYPVMKDAPYARVCGAPWMNIPKDLYIPPDALEVFLDTFEGPLDLLLYLIRKQNLDILDIPITAITHQYLAYVELMQALHLELAADYLVMAASLAEIKSRWLLPRPATVTPENDPRAELAQRLQEYAQFKRAAEDLDALPRFEREIFQAHAQPPDLRFNRPLPTVSLSEVLHALREVLRQVDLRSHHRIEREPLSLRERMSQIAQQIQGAQFIAFNALFAFHEGRMGVVVTFMALLELIRGGVLEFMQTEPFAPLQVRARVVTS